jgi:hypothetical protein
VFRTARDITKNGIQYKAENSFVVPLKQTEYRFIRSLFEPVREFTDSVFYDVSTWVLPMSFNLNCSPITLPKEIEGLAGSEVTSAPVTHGQLISNENVYAYLFEWNEYYTPKALYSLQNNGLTARVSTENFEYDDGILKKKFSAGTILIPASGQTVSGKELYDLMQKTAEDCGITVFGVRTGLTSQGIDLGSNKIIVLKKPSVAMLTGEGTNSSDAGEIWHLLDARFNIPITMITASRFGTADLNRYNVLIIPGSPEISASGLENIRIWNRNGGTLIGYENGNNWLAKNKFAEIEYIPAASDKRKAGIYGHRAGDSQVQLIPGSIFQAKLDLTHPLCFGYTRGILPVFKSTATAVKKDSNIYNNPVQYTDDPLLSGYCTKENIDRIKGTPFASVHGNRIISLYDNTNFRAIWYGTNKLFMNAIFFGQIIR